MVHRLVHTEENGSPREGQSKLEWTREQYRKVLTAMGSDATSNKARHDARKTVENRAVQEGFMTART